MRTTKKNNKIISFLTALVIMLNILPMCIVQADDTVAISTVNDLKEFFEKCVYDEYSKNKKFVLQNDIDLNGVEIKSAEVFCGTFEGGGHSIKNVKLSFEGSNKGLFCSVTKEGQIRDLNITGDIKVTFKYKLSSKKTLKLTQKFKIIDTIPPKVSCSKDSFVYEVASKDKKDMNSESNITDITNMVKACASTNESGSKITVYTVNKEELDEGEFPVVIKAQDLAGNVGSYQVMVKIVLRDSGSNKKYTPPKDLEKIRKQKAGLEETTKKSEKKKKKEKTTKAVSQDETEE